MTKIYTRGKFFAMVLPITLFFTMFMIIPIFVAFYYSFTNFRGLGEYEFFGLRNYAQILRDPHFFRGLRNTFTIVVVHLSILIPFSFLIANFVAAPTRKNEVYKVIFFAPNTIAAIVVGLMWSFMLDPVNGFINIVLRTIGLDFLALQWIGGMTLTPYSVAVISNWAGAGFAMIIWLAGIKSIPRELYESAEMDGANKQQQMFYITMPMCKEHFKVIFVFAFNGALRVFESVWVLTGGGPNHASQTMVSYMFTTTFISRLYGYGMAVAVIQFLIALSFSILFLRITRREVDL